MADGSALPPVRKMPNVEERFWRKVRKTEGCWEWQSGKRDGYGKFYVGRKHCQAHRLSYEWAKGPIPADKQIDHLCRNRACVNPDHLEAVTGQENLRRSPVTYFALNRQKTHCRKGHEFNTENTLIRPNGERVCRKCHRVLREARRLKAKAIRRAERLLRGRVTS